MRQTGYVSYKPLKSKLPIEHHLISRPHLKIPKVLDYIEAQRHPERLGYSEEPLVSSDYIANPNSATVDAISTAVSGHLVKVVAWYDNEWGYSNRVADLVYFIAGIEE